MPACAAQDNSEPAASDVSSEKAQPDSALKPPNVPATPEPEQGAPEPEPTPAPEKPSPWDPYASLRLSLDYDETVIPRGRSSTDPTEDFFLSAIPAVGIRYKQGKTYANLGYSYRYLHYDDNDERDSFSHSGNLNLRQGITDIWSLSLRDRLSYFEDTGGEQTETITRPTTYYFNQITLDNNLNWPSNMDWTLTTGFERRDYEDPSQKDYRGYDIEIQNNIRISDNFKTLLSYQFRRLNVEKSENSPNHRVLAGIEYRLTRVISLSAGAGALAFPQEDVLEFAGRVGLNLNFEKVTWRLSYNRDSNVSVGSSQVTRRDFLASNITWRFAADWYVSNHTTFLFDYSIEDDRVRTNTLRTQNSVGYAVTDWMSVEAYWGYTDQNAEGRTGRSVEGQRMGIASVFSF